MRSLLSSFHPHVAIAYGILAAVILAIVAGAVLGSRALVRANTIPIGDVHTGSQSVDGEGASAVHAEIILAFGQMTLSGGADELLKVDFVSNVTGMRPFVVYDVTRGQGDLMVFPSVPSGFPDARLLSEYRNEWNLSFHDDTPLDLGIVVGTGLGAFDVRGLALTNLEIEVGTGEATVDLRGDWAHGFDTVIDGGAGKATILLPEEVGVRVGVERGIGAVNVSGLEKVDGVYINPAYGKSDITLDIEVQAGMGELNLEVRGDEETH